MLRHLFLYSPRSLISLFATCIFLLGAKLLAQQGFIPSNTKGACSPIVYGNRNVIECGDLSKTDAAILADILNEARASNKGLAEIKEMLQKALDGQDPNRSVVTYTPNGQAMTSNNSGGMNMTLSEGEMRVFLQLQELEKTKKWAELISLAKTEKEKVPTWYTIYFVEAEGDANSCNLNKAIELIDFFISKVTGIASYEEPLKDAITLRSQIKLVMATPMRYGCPTANP